MEKQIVEELRSYLQDGEDIKNLREGLYVIVWEYLENNIETGLNEKINGKFLKDFNSLLEVLSILETSTKE